MMKAVKSFKLSADPPIAMIASLKSIRMLLIETRGGTVSSRSLRNRVQENTRLAIRSLAKPTWAASRPIAGSERSTPPVVLGAGPDGLAPERGPGPARLAWPGPGWHGLLGHSRRAIRPGAARPAPARHRHDPNRRNGCRSDRQPASPAFASAPAPRSPAARPAAWPHQAAHARHVEQESAPRGPRPDQAPWKSPSSHQTPALR